MFFARHLGFQSFHVYPMENHTWRLKFYNSSNRVGILKVSGIVKVSNDDAGPIRFNYKPTCKDIVNELLTCASKGERIASMTSSCHIATLMQPFTTIEELLVKMDLELSYEQ